MTLHNITGSERSGPHVVIRHMAQPRRRTFGHIVLEAIGGATVLLVLVALMWSGIR